MYNKLHILQLLQSNVQLVAYGHILLFLFTYFSYYGFIYLKKKIETIIQIFYFIIFRVFL
jgi:hypothetical protein